MKILFQDKGNDQQFILIELKTGNVRAFEFVFKQYYKSLSQFSFSIIKDKDKAESLVQEVFIKLWEKHDNLPSIDNLQAFLMTMVRNHSIDYLRTEKAKSKAYSKIITDETANTTEDQLSKNEFEEKLLLSLQKLPERCRMAFEMSRLDGFTNKEIAKNMRISIKGVEALIGRSLKTLRVELKEFLPSSKNQKVGGSILFSLFMNRFKRLKTEALLLI